MLSAAALRRRLLERQTPATSAALPADDEASSPSGDAAGAGVELRRKIPVRGPVKKEASVIFEKMLLEGDQAPAADEACVLPNSLSALT